VTKYGLHYETRSEEVKKTVNSLFKRAGLNITSWDRNASHIYLYNVETSYGGCGLCDGSWWTHPEWTKVSLDQLIEAVGRMNYFRIGNYEVKFSRGGASITANNVRFTYNQVKEIVKRMKGQ